MKKALIFDMDGTLWDAADNIVYSWNRTLQALGYTDVLVTKEWLESLLGSTMDAFARGLFPDMDLKDSMDILEKMEVDENEYLNLYGANLLGDVEQVFRDLKDMGYEIAIVSNCQAGYIEAFLDHYDLSEYVDDLECYGNNGQVKSCNIRAVADRNGYDACWYVGDTEGDHQSCQEAGVPFIWASYGFGSVQGDDYTRLDHLDDLPQVMSRL